jgi:uncharacterized protein (DUF1697 family)
MVYVALLRGINVGGNSKISMKELAETFSELGFQHIKTYINSGNIIFSDTSHTPSKLVSLLEVAIKKDFDLEIKVVVRDLKAISNITKSLPKTWLNDSTMKTDVMFLWEEIDSPKVLNELPTKPEIDEVKYVPGAILWRVDRENVTKSGMLRIIGTKLYKQMTIRNCNTVRKLHALMQEVAE